MRPTKRASLGLPHLLASYLLLGLAAQGPALGQTGYQKLSLPVPRHQVTAATGEIEVDGRIDEAAWERALAIRLEWETQPGENLPAPVETRCFITYDRSHLYVAFAAADPEPGKIRARHADRDAVFSDDFVGIVLDTFNDERRAFQFFVNPVGVQMDVFLDQVNDNEDTAWDAIWDSAGRVTDTGYEVELAIPFSSLRFPATAGEQTWGLDALRFWPRADRHRVTSVPRDRDNSCHLCQLAKIVGFEGVTPGRNLEIAPTLTASRTDLRASAGGNGFESGDEDTDGGLTLRWGLTPNLILSGALNPDFSQIEADAAQLSINEQFALFFPERRPFFLEGADFFGSPLNAVFTRNVADPDWGVKVSGKAGASGFGAFLARDARVNLLLPGSQRSSTATIDLESTAAVARYRHDLGASSTVGALVTSREGEGYENQVYGLDGLYRFSDSDRIAFQALASRTRYPGAFAREHELPVERFGGRAIRVAYNHDSRNWQGYATYEDIGADFRADMGFMPRVDYDFALGGLKRVWWGQEGSWYNRLSVGADWDLTRDQSGQELERESEVFLDYNGPRQSYVSLRLGERDRFFNGVSFPETFGFARFELEPTANVQATLRIRVGDDVDFANTRPAELLSLAPSLRLDLGRHVRVNLEHETRRLDVAGGTLFTANLSQLRAVYQHDLRTLVRAVLQYTDVERDPTLFSSPVEPRDRRLLSQLLFSYKLNPQTVLFLGYSDTSAGDQETAISRTDRTYFLKIGYAWVL